MFAILALLSGDNGQLFMGEGDMRIHDGGGGEKGEPSPSKLCSTRTPRTRTGSAGTPQRRPRGNTPAGTRAQKSRAREGGGAVPVGRVQWVAFDEACTGAGASRLEDAAAHGMVVVCASAQLSIDEHSAWKARARPRIGGGAGRDVAASAAGTVARTGVEDLRGLGQRCRRQAIIGVVREDATHSASKSAVRRRGRALHIPPHGLPVG